MIAFVSLKKRRRKKKDFIMAPGCIYCEHWHAAVFLFSAVVTVTSEGICDTMDQSAGTAGLHHVLIRVCQLE